jgi:hypothetical protein
MNEARTEGQDRYLVFATVGRSHAAYEILSEWADTVDEPLAEYPEALGMRRAAAATPPAGYTVQLFDLTQRLVRLQQSLFVELIESVFGRIRVKDDVEPDC